MCVTPKIPAADWPLFFATYITRAILMAEGLTAPGRITPVRGLMTVLPKLAVRIDHQTRYNVVSSSGSDPFRENESDVK